MANRNRDADIRHLVSLLMGDKQGVLVRLRNALVVRDSDREGEHGEQPPTNLRVAHLL